MASSQQNLSPCYVVVKKLSLEDISRITINPFYVKYTCGRCKKRIFPGRPKCVGCQTYYHMGCANIRKICCGLEITSKMAEPPRDIHCAKCKERVLTVGPQCSVCKSIFHNTCVGPHYKCCQLNLYEPRNTLKVCNKCSASLDFGPKCPLCMKVYHPTCVEECCGIKFIKDQDTKYKCSKCKRKVALMAAMCMYCGSLSHAHCLRNCCRGPVPLEVYIIPSFRFLSNYYKNFDKKRAWSTKLEIGSRTGLRSRSLPDMRKKKKKTVSSQTQVAEVQTMNFMDTFVIQDVKTELEHKEVDIEDCAPPILEREDRYSPEPSSSSVHMPDITESEDTLQNLFEFLYKMVKKFPPHVQTQVKIDLFRVVTEAEMKANETFQNL